MNKKEQDEREEGLELIEAILVNLGVGVSASVLGEDNRPRLIMATDRFYSLLGYTREQFEAERVGIIDVMHPDDWAMATAFLEEVMDSDVPAGLTHRAIKRDGSVIHVRWDLSLASISGVGERVLLSVISDVSSVVEAEKAVALSAERLRAVIENINGCVTAVTIKNGVVNFLLTNDQYYSILGFTREQYEAEVQDNFDLVHPEDRLYVIAETQRATDERRSLSVEYRVIRRDGAVRWIRSNISIVSFPDIDEPVQLSVGNDVTELHETERWARDAAEQLWAIVNNVSGGVSAATLTDGRVSYVFVNDEYYSMFGYTKEQFEDELPNGIMDIILPEDKPIVYAAAEENIKTGHHKRLEFRVRKRDGEIIWVRSNSSVCHLESYDQPVHLAISTDITKETVREHRNMELTERFRLLVDNIPGGIATVEAEDNELRVLYFNDGFYDYTGYSREEFRVLLRDDPLTLVFEEDMPGMYDALEQLWNGEETASCTYRCRTKDSERFYWFEMKGSVAERRINGLVFNLVQFDITARKEAEEQLRISEEQFRVAASIGERAIARYDIKARTYHHNDRTLLAMGFPEIVENVPDAFVEAGNIAEEGLADYIEFYERIRRGEHKCSLDSSVRTEDGKYRWCRREATVIFDAKGEPSVAIIVTTDITEQREKEAVYKRWQQSLSQMPPESYSLFRCNLSKNTSFDSTEGTLLSGMFTQELTSFDSKTILYAENWVHPDDRAGYISALNSDTLLASYYRDKRIVILEYRELLPESGFRWLKLTVEMVEFPNSTDVEAYLMYEDIDETKREELLALERAETDALTGVLNRAAFARETQNVINESKGAQHVFMMLDVDGFKRLNDSFGHAAGDQALMEIAASLRSILRHGDLLGRLGGDEFIVLLRDIPYFAVAEKKARQICSLIRKSYSVDVHISASVGIAVYPRDGEDFDALYRNADAALYHIKGSGKDNFAFFEQRMDGKADSAEARGAPTGEGIRIGAGGKRRMLIVDGDNQSRAELSHMFEEEYLVERAEDAKTALIRLRHFGAGLSVVLLRLSGLGEDSFTLLESIRASVELRSVPVIMLGDEYDKESCLRAIKTGAADYVTRPLDEDIIHLRVESAVSKAENERLRAQNSYLLLQGSEEARYRTVLESTGTVVIEYDWINGVFSYDAYISQHIAGKYDDRRLWRILLSDRVASAMEVKEMQELVHDLANDRGRETGSMAVRLKTPQGDTHWFRMNVFKQSDEYRLTDKMILTFNDINEERLAEERLRFQAERDELTGLYNRRTFLMKAQWLVRGRSAYSFIMSVGDIDNFKMVNDRYGHAEGDKLLRYAAERLQADVDEVGGLCGRLGNDVFASIVPNSAQTLERTAKYPRELLAGYPLEVGMTFTIGYYQIDDSSISVESMLDRASMAKQSVKGSYGAKVACYDEDMRKKLRGEQDISERMELALANGEFEIYLQPQYDHRSGRICGAEALVRWLGDDGEPLYYPNDFIPLFERNGFITRLDEYVWQRTVDYLRRWLSLNLPVVPVSVNVSRLDTRDPKLKEKLLDVVRRAGVPIDLFRLEITESLFEEDPERLAGVIENLHEAGFLIEMDDFGSGYSSLNILKDVSVDILKLDMRFFTGVDKDRRGGVILGAVMGMARALGLPVIAEGVETREQADYLTGIGCPLVQGYLYSRPMPAEHFEALLLREGETGGAV